MTTKSKKKQAVLPVLPLRDMVIFPGCIQPVYAGRAMSLAAIQAMGEGDQIVILTQKKPDVNEPKAEDLFDVGVVARVLQRITLQDGSVKLLINALYRVKVQWLDFSQAYISAMVEPMVTVRPEQPLEEEAWLKALMTAFTNFTQVNTALPKDLINLLKNKNSLEETLDVASHYLDISASQRQELLEEPDLIHRVEKVLARVSELIDKVQIEEKIQRQVKRQMDRNQREYYLNEQMKAIQKELGRGEEDMVDIDQYAEKIAKSGMSDEAREKCESELKKLRMMPAMSAEATVVRGYLDTLLALPWTKKSRVSKNIKEASDILEADHYGLEKVKERILEYLAGLPRVDKVKARILC